MLWFSGREPHQKLTETLGGRADNCFRRAKREESNQNPPSGKPHNRQHFRQTQKIKRC